MHEARTTETVIGRVVRPFGIRGELKIRVLTDVPDRFQGLTTVTLGRADGSRLRANVLSVRPHQGHILMRFQGIDSVEAAEDLRGAELLTPIDTDMPMEADTYYSSDLIGLGVRLPDGREIGRVSDVLRYPAQDLLVVGDALIPAVRAIVTHVDLTRGTITINPPEGLLPDGMVRDHGTP